ncbi:MAG: TIGR03936 family radical SAM-associated protein [Clostridiales bacterium]|jgi:radical SAM-linked protein|nr:TIGR03936 family radical SAM-associated protein [Clostridiales bacterium]
MNKYLFKYEKTGNARFIGHLDLLRAFGRAVSRAGLPIAYSEGFNPHRLVSFALPLPVGMSGLGEIAALRMAEPVEPRECAGALNACLPEGLRVLAGREMPREEKEPAALVRFADFRADFADFSVLESVERAVGAVLAANSLLLERESKKGVLSFEARQDIYDIYAKGSSVFARVSQGSAVNLRFDALIARVCRDAGAEPDKIKCARLALYKEADGGAEEIF